ncbi:MAG: ABC transporter permease [Candidatus Caldarchaeum sp.]|nr:ABC transporter permease [Candidatus Caldarchaeum sp.]
MSPLPSSGNDFSQGHTGWWEGFLDLLSHLFLPTLTLFLINLGLVTRTVRTSMLEALRSEFVVAARAKGLPERRVLFRHAFRNSLTPLITLIGLQLGWLLSGAVIVETVFAWPGMGRLLFTSIGSRDYPVVMGIFLLVSTAVVVSNLITELLYAYVDPRIRRAK